MRCFILAGGFATRLWPLTEHRAKPLLPLAGKPILTHLIKNIPDTLPVIVSTNAVFQDAFHAWKNTIQKPVDILIEDTIHDDHKIGALGAVAKWIEDNRIDEDVLLLTGDNYFGCSLETFTHAFHDITRIAVHDIGSIEHARAYGTICAEGNVVTGFEEKPAHPKTSLVNTGISLLPHHILPILTAFAASHPDNVGGIFEELLRRQEKIECLRLPGVWFDIGTFDAYLEATKSLVGHTIINNGSLSSDSVTEESVVIGRESTVHASTLRNVVLFEDCHITDCVLEDCIIDNHCVLSRVDLVHKMIREGTILKRK